MVNQFSRIFLFAFAFFAATPTVFMTKAHADSPPTWNYQAALDNANRMAYAAHRVLGSVVPELSVQLQGLDNAASEYLWTLRRSSDAAYSYRQFQGVIRAYKAAKPIVQSFHVWPSELDDVSTAQENLRYYYGN